MRFLIVGLGSMGKRRIRNLQTLGWTDIIGFDPRSDRREEVVDRYGVEVIAGWEEAAATKADAWIISTPPDTHVDYGLQAIDVGASFFTEANVTDDRTPGLIEELKGSDVIGAPSCTFQYYAGPLQIKKLFQSEETLV